MASAFGHVLLHGNSNHNIKGAMSMKFFRSTRKTQGLIDISLLNKSLGCRVVAPTSKPENVPFLSSRTFHSCLAQNRATASTQYQLHSRPIIVSSNDIMSILCICNSKLQTRQIAHMRFQSRCCIYCMVFNNVSHSLGSARIAHQGL